MPSAAQTPSPNYRCRPRPLDPRCPSACISVGGVLPKETRLPRRGTLRLRSRPQSSPGSSVHLRGKPRRSDVSPETSCGQQVSMVTPKQLGNCRGPKCRDCTGSLRRGVDEQGSRARFTQQPSDSHCYHDTTGPKPEAFQYSASTWDPTAEHVGLRRSKGELAAEVKSGPAPTASEEPANPLARAWHLASRVHELVNYAGSEPVLHAKS